MSNYFESFAIGEIQNCTKTPCQTYVFTGVDPSHNCEVVEGDNVSILSFNGTFWEDTILKIDMEDHTITFEQIGTQNFKNIYFIGRQ